MEPSIRSSEFVDVFRVGYMECVAHWRRNLSEQRLVFPIIWIWDRTTGGWAESDGCVVSCGLQSVNKLPNGKSEKTLFPRDSLCTLTYSSRASEGWRLVDKKQYEAEMIGCSNKAAAHDLNSIRSRFDNKAKGLKFSIHAPQKDEIDKLLSLRHRNYPQTSLQPFLHRLQSIQPASVPIGYQTTQPRKDQFDDVISHLITRQAVAESIPRAQALAEFVLHLLNALPDPLKAKDYILSFKYVL
jgi:hypothetical protein